MEAKQFKQFMRVLGPGILFAGISIGGSHLVQSTRAGAEYGLAMAALVFVALLLKLPFYEYGYRYTLTTGNNLLKGYAKIGRWAIWLFISLNLLTALPATAALTVGTAYLASYLVDNAISPQWMSVILLAVIWGIIMVGRYHMLDRVIKLVVLTLVVCTITAFVIALKDFSPAIMRMPPAHLYTLSGFGFVLALLGWMPCPIEVSAWSSLWMQEKAKFPDQQLQYRLSMWDFYIGYAVTAVMAFVFLGLGALVMFGKTTDFAATGTGFVEQFIRLFTTQMGDQFRWLIAVGGLATLFSSLLIVVDGYSRSVAYGIGEVASLSKFQQRRLFSFFVTVISVVAVLIIFFWSANLATLIDFATIMAFLIAPLFGLLNYKLVNAASFPVNRRPPVWLKQLGIAGLVFLFGFALAFVLAQSSKLLHFG